MRLFTPEHVDTTDSWWTPPHIFDALGVTFDLDVAAPPGGVPWIPADAFYTETDDGLTQPWHGLVWMNPPYSKPGPWVEKLYHHGNGIALLSSDTATAWFQRWCTRADAWCFIDGRLRFVRDADSTSARFPSVLVGYGEGAAPVAQCGLGWVP